MLSNFSSNSSVLYNKLREKVKALLSTETKNKLDFNGTKTKNIKKYFNTQTEQYEFLYPNQVNSSIYIRKKETRPKYIKTYYDPATLKEYKIDTRYQFPDTYILGRSPLFKEKK